MLPNSDEKHGFFTSVVARKAAVRFREIPGNLTMHVDWRAKLSRFRG